MKRSSSELKKLARATLSGKYSTFIGTFVIYSLIVLAASIITSTFSTGFMLSYTRMTIYICVQLVLSFIWSVFGVGFTYQAMQSGRNKPISVGNLFHGFTHHPDRFIVVTLLQTLIVLVLLAPAIIFLVISGFPIYAYNDIFIAISIPLFIIGYVFASILSLGFSLCYYLIIDNADMTAIESLKESWKLMRGNKGRLFYITLSFMGWGFLAGLSFGIGLLWITPYLNVTSAYFYLDIIGELGPVTPMAPVVTPMADSVVSPTLEQE